MKRILTAIFILSSTLLLSQSPQSFSYQAVVRDATGDIIATSPVSLRISILAASAQGQTVYAETHFTTTNQFGLVAVNIGQGTTIYGLFDTIPWNNGSYFIQTEMDATGGANYVLMGTTQILSVPYALYGRDEDYDTSNEIQEIQLLNDTIQLSKNGGNIPIGSLENLGEVKMFAVSISGALSVSNLQSKGWAVCDGTTPSSQGITNATINATPDLQNKFVRMGDDETSGSIGGFITHNHQWLIEDRHNALLISASGGTNQDIGSSFNSSGNLGGAPSLEGGRAYIDGNHYTTKDNHLPPYYELVYFLKVR